MTREEDDSLDGFRKYPMVLAQFHLDPRLRGKLDPADVVQQTMLRPYSAFAGLRDREPVVAAAWLRRILASTLADAVKHCQGLTLEQISVRLDGGVPAVASLLRRGLEALLSGLKNEE